MTSFRRKDPRDGAPTVFCRRNSSRRSVRRFWQCHRWGLRNRGILFDSTQLRPTGRNFRSSGFHVLRPRRVFFFFFFLSYVIDDNYLLRVPMLISSLSSDQTCKLCYRFSPICRIPNSCCSTSGFGIFSIRNLSIYRWVWTRNLFIILIYLKTLLLYY